MMNLEHVQSARATHPQPITQADTRLHGGWLILARVAWIVLVLFLLGVLFASLPTNFAALHQPGSSEWYALGSGQMTTSEIRVLQQYGLSLDVYAWFWLVIIVGEALVWFGVGGILFWRKSDDWMALLVALMVISWGVNVVTANLLYSSSIWRIPENGVLLLEGLTTVFTLAFFPNGRSVPRRIVWITLIDPANVAVYLLFLRPLRITGWALFNNPLNAVIWWGCFIILVLAQLYRYFWVSNTLERQQTKWVAFSFFLVLLNVGLLVILPGPPSVQHNGLLIVLITVLILNSISFISLLVPISLGLAMFRYRLWDIDILINRTLVYGILTASVIGIYALVVGTLGIMLQAQGNFFIALLAAGLVAVLFQPLRLRLQSGVNRLMYGERDTPDKVLSRLGQRLEITLAPDAVLSTIVETVAQALKLPYAAITLKQVGAFVPAAAYGQMPEEEPVHLPLVYQNEQIGELSLAPRTPGETFTSADRALLSDLARQAGIAAHAVRLTADLQRVAVELQHSRTELVATREEERRRLRRDLHDGLGSALTSVMFQLDAACNLLDHDPQAVRTLLMELKGQMQTSIADIRQLVYNLRPPILDEWGLVAALREQVAQYQLNQVQVTVDAPESLLALPAAVEVAAYRIVLEALANVIRHAQASSCAIRLAVTEEMLIVEIQDNGKGLPPHYHAGVGISAMRERSAELGGSCIIENVAVGGTRVSARLPLLKE